MKRNAPVLVLCCLFVLLLSGCRALAPINPAGSREPVSAEAPSHQAPATAVNFGAGPLTKYIGATYEQLENAYGPSQIFHWYELGLYGHFEDVNITFFYDMAFIRPNYTDVSVWLDDPGEFTFGNGDPAYNFDTGRYSPSDFKVIGIGVWGNTLARLLDELGIESPATLKMLNKSFGQIRAAEENLMIGLMQAGMYTRENYEYEFTFDENGRYATSARILYGAGENGRTGNIHTVMAWCGALELDKETIRLLEPTDYNGGDIGGEFSYSISPSLVRLFQAAPPTVGKLYLVTIDEHETVIQLNPVLPPPESAVLDVLTQYEETAYLMQELGMVALAEMEMVFINGNLCYTALLGTNHDGHFVRERTFAVDVEHAGIYEYDEPNDSYMPLGRG